MSGEYPNNPSDTTVEQTTSTSFISSSTIGSFNSHSHKRPVSPDPDSDHRVKKKMKEDINSSESVHKPDASNQAIDGNTLAEDLAQELQCGCCSELVYKPVVVIPCDHFFCGSCCTLWIKNGGTNCPACRSVSTAVLPSRTVQSMVDVLLRSAPHRQRTERERMQADEVYPDLRPFRIPAPREPSPEPTLPSPSNFLQPCPHCSPNNQFHWMCPRPIPNPATDAENAWHITNGAPPGHGFCGNCESVLALRAPNTTRCDFCQVSFCGISVQNRCSALSLTTQSPAGLSDVAELLESSEVYDCFENNHTEVDYMIDYITTHDISPKQIYRQIAAYIQSQPNGFRPLFDLELFSDMHPVSGGIDPDPSATRRFICRQCAAEVFVFGLRDWWIRERRKATEKGLLLRRPDCPDGANCERTDSLAHAKEFNHLFDNSNFEDQSQSRELPSGPSRPHPPSLSIPDGAIPPLVSLPSITDLDIPIPNFDSSSQAPLPIFIRSEVAEFAANVPFSRFVHGLHDQMAHDSVPGLPFQGRQQTQETGTSPEHLESDRHPNRGDDLLIEPSSSQSVEASLVPLVSSEYDSDQGVNEYQDYRADFNDTETGAHIEARYDAASSSDLGSIHDLAKAEQEDESHDGHSNYTCYKEIRTNGDVIPMFLY